MKVFQNICGSGQCARSCVKASVSTHMCKAISESEYGRLFGYRKEKARVFCTFLVIRECNHPCVPKEIMKNQV